MGEPPLWRCTKFHGQDTSRWPSETLPRGHEYRRDNGFCLHCGIPGFDAMVLAVRTVLGDDAAQKVAAGLREGDLARQEAIA